MTDPEFVPGLPSPDNMKAKTALVCGVAQGTGLAVASQR